MNNNFRPVYEQPIYKIIIPVCDLSLDKAIPQFAAAIDAQIDCDDASDNFIKKKLHSNIRSSSAGPMTMPYGVVAVALASASQQTGRSQGLAPDLEGRQLALRLVRLL